MERAKQNQPTNNAETRTRPNGRPVRSRPPTLDEARIGSEKHNFSRDIDDYDDYNN
jgi:hypothetical protein